MLESEKLNNVIEAANEAGRFFCKFVSANDAGVNGNHQEGIYLSKLAWDIFFPGVERIIGTRIEKLVNIHIDYHPPFESRLVYYGERTRNEYRITRLWTNSPFDRTKHVGDLIVFIPLDHENFKLYLLDGEEEIDTFIEHFSLSLVNKFAVFNSHHDGQLTSLNSTIEQEIENTANTYQEFPNTATMAEISRNIFINFYRLRNVDPDKHLLKYIETEYSVFRAIEKTVYAQYLTEPFGTLEPLLEFANSALNRRKSRAGKSLEHHVNYIFNNVNQPIPFSHPGQAEGNKKPDFLFPSNEAYANTDFNTNNLIFLGAKTTCKDRWRQVTREADKIQNKHLLTLQQGISVNQLDEMEEANLTLVVPQAYHTLYPETHRHRLWTVSQFIEYAQEKYTI